VIYALLVPLLRPQEDLWPLSLLLARSPK